MGRFRRVFDAALPATDLPRQRLATRRIGDEDRLDRDLARYRKTPVVRPVLTLGPYFFIDIAANATQDGVLAMPTATTSFGTTTFSYVFPLPGRVVGCTATLSANISSGSVVVRAKIGSNYVTIGGSEATAGSNKLRAWLGWKNGIPFTARDIVRPALTSTNLSPTTLEANVLLFVMLDVDES